MRRFALVFVPAFALLAACVSVLPEPEAPRGLYSIAPASVKASLPANVIIREFEAPELISGTAMIAEDSDGARRLVRSVEWSGRLTREMQMALIDSFDTDGAGTALLPELGVSARFRVIGRVQTLLLRGDAAECVATVSVADGSARGLVGQTTVRSGAVALRDGAPDRAIALRQAAEGCVAQLASATVDILSSAEPDA